MFFFFSFHTFLQIYKNDLCVGEQVIDCELRMYIIY